MAAALVPAPNGVAALSLTGLLAAVPFGISVQTIGIGMLFAIVGLMGRFAFEMQKALESNNKPRLLSSLGWLGAGLFGSPFISVAWIALLRAIGAQTDATTVIGLLFLGYSGPKGVILIANMLTGAVAQRLGIPPKAVVAESPPKVG